MTLHNEGANNLQEWYDSIQLRYGNKMVNNAILIVRTRADTVNTNNGIQHVLKFHEIVLNS